MVIGDEALGLEGRGHRRAEVVGEGAHRVHRVTCTVADDDHRPARDPPWRRRPPAALRWAVRSRRLPCGRRGPRPPRRHRPSGPAPRRGTRDERRHDRRWRSSWPGKPARHGATPPGAWRCSGATSANAADRSTSWKAPRPRTEDGTWPERARTGARSTLASYRPVSRLVDPGPAMPRQPAGPTGELAERGGGERRRSFVTDTDVGQVPALSADRSASARPRFEWPTMPKTWVRPQFDQGLDHDVGDGPAPGLLVGKFDVDGPVADVGGETRRSIGEPLGWSAVEG